MKIKGEGVGKGQEQKWTSNERNPARLTWYAVLILLEGE